MASVRPGEVKTAGGERARHFHYPARFTGPDSRSAFLRSLNNYRESLAPEQAASVDGQTLLRYMDDVAETVTSALPEDYTRMGPAYTSCVRFAYALSAKVGLDDRDLLGDSWLALKPLYESGLEGSPALVDTVTSIHRYVHEEATFAPVVKYIARLQGEREMVADLSDANDFPAVGLATLFFDFPTIAIAAQRFIAETRENIESATYEFYTVILPSLLGNDLACDHRSLLSFLRAASILCSVKAVSVQEAVRECSVRARRVLDDYGVNKSEDALMLCAYSGYSDIPVDAAHVSALENTDWPTGVKLPPIEHLTMDTLVDVGRALGLIARDAFFLFDALLGLSIDPAERADTTAPADYWFGITFATLSCLPRVGAAPNVDGNGLCWFNAKRDVFSAAPGRKERRRIEQTRSRVLLRGYPDEETLPRSVLGNENETGGSGGKILLSVVVHEYDARQMAEKPLITTVELHRDAFHLASVAQALHEDWLAYRKPVPRVAVAALGTGKYKDETLVSLENFLRAILGASNVDTSLRYTWETFEEASGAFCALGLDDLFGQALRSAVFTGVSSPRILTEFFAQNEATDVECHRTRDLMATLGADFSSATPTPERVLDCVIARYADRPFLVSLPVIDRRDFASASDKLSALDVALGYFLLSPDEAKLFPKA